MVFILFFSHTFFENGNEKKTCQCGGKKGFGAYCGSRRAAVRLNALQRKKILQIHDGLRSLVASGLITGRNGPFPPAKRMGQLVSINLKN